MQEYTVHGPVEKAMPCPPILFINLEQMHQDYMVWDFSRKFCVKSIDTDRRERQTSRTRVHPRDTTGYPRDGKLSVSVVVSAKFELRDNHHGRAAPYHSRCISQQSRIICV